MMRSRGAPGGPRHPVAYQCHPRDLIFPVASPLRSCSLHALRERFLDLVPAHVLPAFRAVWSGAGSFRPEVAAPFALWVEQAGGADFRVPNAYERARATGQADYWARLGLTPPELYDAVGNYFDPDALRLRVASPLEAWAANEERPVRRFPAPSFLRELFAVLAVPLESPQAMPSPFPPGLDALLLIAELRAAWPAAFPARLPPPSHAAGSGRQE